MRINNKLNIKHVVTPYDSMLRLLDLTILKCIDKVDSLNLQLQDESIRPNVKKDIEGHHQYWCDELATCRAEKTSILSKINKDSIVVACN